MLTRFDRTLSPSYQLGYEDGLELARSQATEKRYYEARRQGEARLFRRFLEMKFGPLAQEVDDRVLNAPIDQIDQWAERYFPAKTLDDVLNDQ